MYDVSLLDSQTDQVVMPSFQIFCPAECGDNDKLQVIHIYYGFSARYSLYNWLLYCLAASSVEFILYAVEV
jgi:hypothetical protein